MVAVGRNTPGRRLRDAASYRTTAVTGRKNRKSSPQRLQRRFGLLPISGIKSLDELAIDLGRERAGFIILVLLQPEPSQAHRHPPLQRFRLLVAPH